MSRVARFLTEGVPGKLVTVAYLVLQVLVALVIFESVETRYGGGFGVAAGAAWLYVVAWYLPRFAARKGAERAAKKNQAKPD